MTLSSDIQSKQEPLRRRRFRFGLKAAFVLMTLVCLMLGWRMSRQRQAAEIISRSRAVLDVIEINIATAPSKTSFTKPAHLRQWEAKFMAKTRSDAIEQSGHLGSMFSNGRHYTMATRGLSLDITKLAASSDIKTASVQIRTHCEQGLSKLGLSRALTTNGEKATSIWQMADHGIHFVIDVDSVKDQSDVRIIFMHNEKLSIW